MAFDYAPPKYAQVVAEIKQRIERGDYPPGTLLPSEHQLVAEFGVSRPTIVKALSALRQEGGSTPSRAEGSSCAAAPPWPMPSGRRPAHDVLELPETELSGELIQAGVKLSRRQRTDPARAGARARRRSCGSACSADDGEPVELASVWLPLDLAAGTDLAAPELLNESLRHHLYARKKVRFDHAVERITARHPTGEEAELLQVAPDAPVLGVIVAAYDATRHPCRSVDLVLPGERHELHDAYPFT